MGTIFVTLPINVSGNFKVRDKKAAKRLVEELEKIGERVSPFDEVFGIWAGREETSDELTRRLRHRNNSGNG